MKQISFFILTLTLLVALPYASSAQVKVGDNPTTIDDGSILEVESTSSAFVPPRMTAAQMNAIPTPLLGAIVFNTDVNCMCEYRGATQGWMNTCLPPKMLHLQKTNSRTTLNNIGGTSYINSIGYDMEVINTGGIYTFDMLNQELTVSEGGVYEVIMQTSFITAQGGQMTQGVARDGGGWLGRMSTFSSRPNGYNSDIGDGFIYTTLLTLSANQTIAFLAAANNPGSILALEGGDTGEANVTNITLRKVQ